MICYHERFYPASLFHLKISTYGIYNTPTMSANTKRPAASKKASRGKNVARDVEPVVTEPVPVPVPVAAPEPVPAPAPVTPAAPVAAPAPVAPVAVPAESSSDPDGIRPARVRHLMDSELLNKVINDAISDSKAVCKRVKQLEKELSSGKVTESVQTIENSVKKTSKSTRDLTDAERVARQQELAGLSERYKTARSVVDAHKPYRTRFSLTTAAAVTAYADHVLSCLFAYAGANLVGSGAKTLSREHFLQDSIRTQEFYPLIADLDVVRGALCEQHRREMESKHARELELAVKSAVKAAERKIYSENKGLRKKKAEVKPEAKPEETKPAEETTQQAATKDVVVEAARGEFRTYIAATWKKHPAAQNAGATGKSARYKFGGDAKQFLCDLIEQLIANVTYLMDLQAQFNDTKTINEKSVIHVIKTKLANVGALKREETLSMADGLVVDPTALKAARAAKTPFDINNLPKIAGKVVTRTVLYKSSLLDELQKNINAAIAKAGESQKNQTAAQ